MGHEFKNHFFPFKYCHNAYRQPYHSTKGAQLLIKKPHNTNPVERIFLKQAKYLKTNLMVKIQQRPKLNNRICLPT